MITPSRQLCKLKVRMDKAKERRNAQLLKIREKNMATQKKKTGNAREEKGSRLRVIPAFRPSKHT
jgi:hypothetical protein